MQNDLQQLADQFATGSQELGLQIFLMPWFNLFLLKDYL